MIHQKTFATINNLISWEPDVGYASGDILFAYVDRNILGHISCGMFRLLDNFDTSGETNDGVFIIFFIYLFLYFIFCYSITSGISFSICFLYV